MSYIIRPYDFRSFTNFNELIKEGAGVIELNLSNTGKTPRLKSLPSDLSALTSLRKLILYNNELMDVPECIKSFTKLEELNLEGNLIIRIPDWIGELTNLKRLNLSYNYLRDLPDSLIKLVNLEELNINYNLLGKYHTLRDELIVLEPDSLKKLRTLRANKLKVEINYQLED